MRFGTFMFALLVAAIIATGGTSSSKAADFGIAAFDGQVAAAPTGGVFTQAGGHPYEISTSFQLNTYTHPVYGANWPVEPLKDVIVDLPPGLVGNPGAYPKCTLVQLTAFECPVASEVGTASVVANHTRLQDHGVYEMIAPPGVPARLAANIFGTLLVLDASVRSDSDYGLTLTARNQSEGVAVVEPSVTIWGIPADPRHDEHRNCSQIAATYLTLGCTSGAPPSPFITLPTRCTPDGIGLPTTLQVDSWFDPGDFKTATFTSHLPPGFTGSPGIIPEPPLSPSQWGPAQGTTGCDAIPFDPELSAQPAQPARANSPAAFTFDLMVPVDTDTSATTLAQGHLKKAVVTLPQGVRVSPSSASGLGACTPAQVGLHDRGDASCPDSAKVGAVTVDTPLLEEPLTGSVYLAAPHDNPSNTLLALYIVVKGPGVIVKLPGRVDADPTTGQLTATFDNNPQLPFSRLHIAFKDGPRSPLVNPPECGVYTTHAVMTSWSGATKSSDSTFTVDHGVDGGACAARGFAPKLAAGTTGSTAGGSSPFVLNLTRSDSDQELSGLSLAMPTGLLASLKGVPRCPQAAITPSSANCPAGSRIGSATVGAGAGPSPFYLQDQPVYLTDGYGGAPFGLAVVTRAVAGPFDLGTVVVRQALSVDPIDAHVIVASEPLPSILEGIPLQIRDVRVVIDRPGFMRNPTSCVSKQIAAAITSTEGASAATVQGFRATDCQALALAPKLAIVLTGKGQTTDGKHPGVTATVTEPVGQANLKKVAVTLPLSLALDTDNAASDGLCSFVEGSKPDPQCPKSSIVGTATAVTPILDEPLSGPVYFTKNERKDPKSGRSIKTTPKLVIPLVGENGVKLTLTGTSTVIDDRLVTTFDNLPDAPVSSFKMSITGGKKGILVVSGDKADICKATQIADQEVDGQNNKTADADITLATPACGLKVLSKRLTKTSLKVKVGGLGAGRLTVSGAGIKTASRILGSATVATITAALTKAGKRHTPTKAKASYMPAGSKKTTAVVISLTAVTRTRATKQ